MYAQRSGQTQQGRSVKSGNPVAIQVVRFAKKYGLLNDALFWVAWAKRDAPGIDRRRKASGVNFTKDLVTPPVPSKETSAKFAQLISAFEEALAVYKKVVPATEKAALAKKDKPKSGGKSWWSFLDPGAAGLTPEDMDVGPFGNRQGARRDY